MTSQVYEVLPFSTAASVPLLYLNLTCTFLWNVIDIVVVVFSSLLAGRFRRLNRFLEKAKGKVSPLRRAAPRR